MTDLLRPKSEIELDIGVSVVPAFLSLLEAGPGRTIVTAELAMAVGKECTRAKAIHRGLLNGIFLVDRIGWGAQDQLIILI